MLLRPNLRERTRRSYRNTIAHLQPDDLWSRKAKDVTVEMCIRDRYQIVLKDSETATYDGKAYDFSITKVTFKATGKLAQTYTFDGEGTNPAKYEKDYGLTTGELLLDDTTKAHVITGLNDKFAVGVITTLVARCV